VNWQLIIGSGGLIGLIVLIFYCGRWFGKIDHSLSHIIKNQEYMEKKNNEFRIEINERFGGLSEDIKRIDGQISRMEESLRLIDSRISRLEGKDEERFRTEMKLMVAKH
jgi:predicted nuclease with TOPRIM domain